MSSLIGQRLGQYEIVAFLGKGGMATVYRAQQSSMGRDVAIKVIKPDLVESGDFVTRFEREARTVAALSHPHILKVFDYGQHGELVYLVMELLKGGSLADLIRASALPPETTARVLDQIASALDYAHELGIIHRDLKPQNVLLDGKANALLTDFGIAKLVSQNTILTQSGMAMGTPSYMSPEQWQGKPIDSRADIYSLGVMLFEMLAGRLPFQGETPYSMMHMHVSVPPPPLSEIRDDLPPGISEVIARTLAKEPDDRYNTAGEVSAEFRSALAGQPISALGMTNPLPAVNVSTPGQRMFSTTPRTPGPGTAVPTQGKATKSPQQTPVLPPQIEPRRNSGLIIGVISVLIVALLIVAGVTIVAILGGRPTPTAIAAGPTNNIIIMPTVGTLTPSAMPGSSTSSAADQTQAAGVILTQTASANQPTLSPTPDSSTIAALTQRAASTQTAVAIASFTKTLTPNFDQTVAAMIASTQTALATTQENPPTSEPATATPTLPTAVALNSDTPAISVDNAKQITTLNILQNAHTDVVNSVAFSHDGRLIASGGDDAAIWLWDARTGTAKSSLLGHEGRVLSVAFSPNGKFLASASADKTIRLWNAENGTYHSTLRGPDQVVTSVAFSPDSTRLVSGYEDGTVVLWDLSFAKQPISMIGSQGIVYAVAFSPDGTKVASGGEDKIVRLWDVDTGHLHSLLYSHLSNVQTLAFSADGSLLASGGLDNSIQFWDAQTGAFRTLWHSEDDNIFGLAFSPDGKLVAVAGSNKVRLWNVQTGEAIITLEDHQDRVSSVAFSPDGKLLASASADLTIRLWAIKP